MPLAGSMKLKTFLALAGSVAVAVVAVTAIGAGSIYNNAQQRIAEKRQERVRLEERQRAEAAQKEWEERKLRIAKAKEERLATQMDRLEERMSAPKTAPDKTSAPGSSRTSSSPSTEEPDGVVLRVLGKPLGSKKRKDVTPGMRFKINVYQDDGHSVANRAKIDLDRDERWDIKVTWSDGQVTRKVSPDDNDDYTIEERWDGGAWVAR